MPVTPASQQAATMVKSPITTIWSQLARALEHAMQHVQLQSGGTQEQAQAFMGAAEDIRRLLHQFAAGFLKEPNEEVLEQLRQILEAEVVATLSPPEEDAAEAFPIEMVEPVAPEPEPVSAPEPELADEIGPKPPIR